MKNFARIFLFAAYAVAVSAAWAVSPCDGVDRSLTNERKAALDRGVAKQLDNSSVDVQESFQIGSWSIIYVATHDSDDAYLFYSKDPLSSRPVATWGGVALRNEEREIKKWTIKNAPGIPLRLASCFAWHVTQDRDL